MIVIDTVVIAGLLVITSSLLWLFNCIYINLVCKQEDGTQLCTVLQTSCATAIKRSAAETYTPAACMTDVHPYCGRMLPVSFTVHLTNNVTACMAVQADSCFIVSLIQGKVMNCRVDISNHRCTTVPWRNTLGIHVAV